MLEFIAFYQNALRVHCATFYHSALLHDLQHEDVTPSSRMDVSIPVRKV